MNDGLTMARALPLAKRRGRRHKDFFTRNPNRFLSMIDFASSDLIVVGAGFYGMTVAERAASEGFRVIVLDRRDHVGGNAYTYEDARTGVEIHKYGPHLFHTNSREIVDYLSRFTEWTPYEHRVWTTVGGKVFPLPINLGTICLFAGRLLSPAQARALVAESAGGFADPQNLEEKAISLIGRPLYDAFIRGYTKNNGRPTQTAAGGDHYPPARAL